MAKGKLRSFFNKVVRRVRWLLDNGPRRLRSARLRRKKELVDAFVEIAGSDALSELIHSGLTVAERWDFYLQTSRVLSSPKSSRTARVRRELEAAA
jgi:hypothetical protein